MPERRADHVLNREFFAVGELYLHLCPSLAFAGGLTANGARFLQTVAPDLIADRTRRRRFSLRRIKALVAERALLILGGRMPHLRRRLVRRQSQWSTASEGLVGGVPSSAFILRLYPTVDSVRTSSELNEPN